ncbi:acyltransferase family protein [Bifidobacterium catenulatum]|nr:acyltransferase family protein [Bifidobacterium catenulatum]MDF4085655.1 acyltransferase family protein [Bifidobacterium catenulatum]MDF4094026.1 acyltransferase family protein [Bifidobacterium catenulatum]
MVRRRFVGLNGLKGIALIAIVLYHCDQGTLRGGFFGVDIFFTISGFLIFSSLLNHIDSGKGIGFKEYYLKRLRRIYPALILMIPVTVSLAWFINQDMLVGIKNQMVTVMLGCYNWYAIGSGASYFSQMNPDMFRHLWFMSVLLQFYLLAPLLIYMLRKILVRWVPVAVLAGLAVCSALSMGLQYHPGTDPTRVYFGSDTHAMGLWLGAMLAWLLMIIRRGNGRPEETAIMSARLVWSKIGPAVAFAALLILLWMMQHVEQGPAAFYGGFFAASLLSVVLVAGSIPFGSWMQDLLVFKPFDVVGRYSYGIYLWHWPLWLFTKAMFPQWGVRHLGWMLLITFALTACCTAMSWKLVEQPVARGGFIAMIRPLPENGIWDAARCWITIVVVLSTCLMSGYVVDNAPKQTSVEHALEENARMLKEQQGMHFDFDRKHPPTPKKPVHTMPNGQQMVAFGDSVMLASSKGLQSVFPGITVDAETSRSMTKALGLIDKAKSQPEGLRQWVLVGLATNSAVTDGQLNDILNDIGPNHVLVLINAHAPVSWVPGTNDALSDFAATHSNNVVLVDWDATISAYPDELAGDGIHPGMSNTLYAQAVKDAITNWIKQGH